MKPWRVSRTFARYWLGIAAILLAQAFLLAWRSDYFQAVIAVALSAACVLLARTHRRVAVMERAQLDERDPDRWRGKHD